MDALKKQIKETIRVLLDVQKIALDEDDSALFKATVDAINSLVDLFLLLD